MRQPEIHVFRSSEASVLKFLVVLYRKPGMSSAEFVTYMKEVHGPMATKLPGLHKYVQNFVLEDRDRKRPEWDAVVELYFPDRASFEAAWTTTEGKASDADLPIFLDLARRSWSLVEEVDVV
jgi:uncharacterized protein (TIGR02118 family)